LYATCTPSASTGFIASVTAVRLASFTSAALADHCTCPSATWPLCDTARPWKGSTTAEICGTDLSLFMAVSIAALATGSVTFALPPVVAKTIVLWPPLKAGSLSDRTCAAFCASVPGMVKLSLVFPPLTTAMAMAAIAAASQAARTSRRRRKAKRASRYR
jgi:hypothetical protein